MYDQCRTTEAPLISDGDKRLQTTDGYYFAPCELVQKTPYKYSRFSK